MPALKDLKLKICGLRDNALEVTHLGPDYAGFIFYNQSPRYVGTIVDADLLSSLPANIQKVGVFVNQPSEEVRRVTSDFNLQYAQLHGDESVEYCRKLRESGIRIIKAFAGNGKLDQEELKQYGEVIDYFLFDTRLKEYGGSGVRFDWSRLEKIELQKPVFLSGGLDLDNIHLLEDNDHLQIHALDVNSKFEVSPGNKDIEKLKKLMVALQR